MYNNANISLPNFDNSKNINILRSVFVNITSLDELKVFWEAYSSKASSYNLLQLSPYDGFALSYLFQKYPGLKKDILDNKILDYVIVLSNKDKVGEIKSIYKMEKEGERKFLKLL